MKIEKFTEIWLEKCSKQFLLSSGVLSCNNSAYLMFRWPVEIAKLRKWQEI